MFCDNFNNISWYVLSNKFSIDLFSSFMVSEYCSCTLYDDDEKKVCVNISSLVKKSFTSMFVFKFILYSSVFPALSLTVGILFFETLITIYMLFFSDLFSDLLDELFNLE